MTHGVIKNKVSGVEIPGEYLPKSGTSRYIGFVIDGSAFDNSFIESEWDFTPDAPPLPTEPGLYGVKSDPNWLGAYYFGQGGRRWYRINGQTGASSPVFREEVADQHRRFGLVRKVNES